MQFEYDSILWLGGNVCVLFVSVLKKHNVKSEG